MKKLTIIAFAVLSMAACKKDGHMYKACYTTPNEWLNGHHTTKLVTTNFFQYDTKDSIGALNWYKQTDGYKIIEARCDSFWVEYACTVNEWQ